MVTEPSVHMHHAFEMSSQTTPRMLIVCKTLLFQNIHWLFSIIAFEHYKWKGHYIKYQLLISITLCVHHLPAWRHHQPWRYWPASTENLDWQQPFHPILFSLVLPTRSDHSAWPWTWLNMAPWQHCKRQIRNVGVWVIEPMIPMKNFEEEILSITLSASLYQILYIVLKL